MKQRVHFVFIAMLSVFLTLSGCGTGTYFQTISAKDPYTGTVLTLDIPARYSGGDFAASGGCAFDTDQDFSSMVQIAENTEEVAFVDVYKQYDTVPYEGAGIFVEEPNGTYSVFYLTRDNFFGMGTDVLRSVDGNETYHILIPYHLLGDIRIDPVLGTILEGAEYSCVASLDIQDDFESFYAMTGQYEFTSDDDQILLSTPHGTVALSFEIHADHPFISFSLIENR